MPSQDNLAISQENPLGMPTKVAYFKGVWVRSAQDIYTEDMKGDDPQFEMIEDAGEYKTIYGYPPHMATSRILALRLQPNHPDNLATASDLTQNKTDMKSCVCISLEIFYIFYIFYFLSLWKSSISSISSISLE
ncbi:hypothetical protein Tco_1574462 [Tanacetum coccineum]